MCGTYFINQTLYKSLKSKLSESDYCKITSGNIYPKNYGVIIQNGAYKVVKWGLTVSWSKSKIYNARSESVLNKKTFKDDYINNKCLVVASGFYEFDSNREKYQYTLNNSVLFIAGFTHYNYESEEFVILTSEANGKSREIHDRTPVVINREYLTDYLKNRDYTFYNRVNKQSFQINKVI